MGGHSWVARSIPFNIQTLRPPTSPSYKESRVQTFGVFSFSLPPLPPPPPSPSLPPPPPPSPLPSPLPPSQITVSKLLRWVATCLCFRLLLELFQPVGPIDLVAIDHTEMPLTAWPLCGYCKYVPLHRLLTGCI